MALASAMAFVFCEGPASVAADSNSGEQVTAARHERQWMLQASQGPSWIAEGNQDFASLGYCVSSAGDLNNDGYADVIVGAPSYDTIEGNAGRVFVYYGGGDGLPAEPSWTMEGDQQAAELGMSVACAGDVNGDGYDDVILGAYYYNTEQPDDGCVYAYYGGADGLSASPDWVIWGDIPKAHLGRCVAGAGDVNGDGYDDVIIGAFNYRNPEVKEGRAYVYHGGPDGLSYTPAWTAEGNQEYAYFAKTVASAGDVNNDGYDDVIVGATHYDVGSLADAGRICVYHGDSTGLSSTPAWILDGDQENANLGRGIACAGDIDDDGYDDVIVAAPGYDNDNEDAGRVSVYRGSATGLVSSPAWVKLGSQAGALLGAAVSGLGDINNDGLPDIAIGAYGYDNGHKDEGKVFIYQADALGLSTVHSWSSEGGGMDFQLGTSVAGAGDINADGYDDVIIGVPGYSNGQSLEGSAFVYLMFPDTTGPSVEVISPNGGEVWYTQDTHDILWNAADFSGVDSISIYYSIDGGDSFTEITAWESNDGVHSWTVPDVASDSALVKIIAYDPAHLSGRDVSDGCFFIVPDTTGPSVDVTSPNGLETWYIGCEYEIRWIATDYHGVDSVRVEYSIDGGASYTPLAYGEPNDSSYVWTVPDTPSESTLVKLIAYDSRENIGTDVSDDFFAIAPDTVAPQVTIVHPNGGETWSVGSAQTIEWTAEDNNGVDSISIYYSIDGGENYSLMASGELNDSSYAWTVPFELSDTALIGIVAYDRSGITGQDTSDGFFAIVPDVIGPTVAVTSPDGGETWGIGSINFITWIAADPGGVDSVSIYYSANGGDTYSLVSSGEANDSLYVWEIPDTPSDSALVKVIAYDHSLNTGEDVSDSLFVITPDVVDLPDRRRGHGDRIRFWGNSPNPFGDGTLISFYLPTDGEVRLEVFDAAGRLVATLVEGRPMRAGVHRIPWQGLAARGDRLGSGVYFCLFRTGDFIQTRKMILAR